MTIKAVCSWPEAEDVLLILEDEEFGLILYNDPVHMDRGKHGFANNGSITLEAKEARRLAAQLIQAADDADHMEAELQAFFEEEKRREGKVRKIPDLWPNDILKGTVLDPEVQNEDPPKKE